MSMWLTTFTGILYPVFLIRTQIILKNNLLSTLIYLLIVTIFSVLFCSIKQQTRFYMKDC